MHVLVFALQLSWFQHKCDRDLFWALLIFLGKSEIFQSIFFWITLIEIEHKFATISNGAKLCLMEFYFVHVWFRNIRTLSMFNALFHSDFFFFNFAWVFWMFWSNACFGFRASALLISNVLWSNLVLSIFDILFGSLNFLVNLFSADHVYRVWNQYFKHIKWCDAPSYVFLFF